MIPDALAALVLYLRADLDVAALVGTTPAGLVRVFGAELDDAEAATMPHPAIVLSDAGGGPLGEGARSYAPLSNSRVDARCYGETPARAKAVYLAAHAALKGLNRTVVDSCLLHSVVVEGGPIGLREPDGLWPLVLGIYSVKASETQVA